MNNFLDKILAEKRREVDAMPVEEMMNTVARLSFYQTVKNNPQRMHVIGELKRASPSKGDINLGVDFLDQARAYEKAGVSAISVLTDPVFFKGSIDDLRAVAQVVDVPLLCKDFIIDKKQIIRAKNAGASIILLIVAALSDEKLVELYDFASSLGLEVLVETHNQAEMAQAQLIKPTLIGVNNRNLKTFVVDRATSVAMTLPENGAIFISESGFTTAKDVAEVKKNYQAVLVGESLMRAENPAALVKSLQVSRLSL